MANSEVVRCLNGVADVADRVRTAGLTECASTLECYLADLHLALGMKAGSERPVSATGDLFPPTIFS